MNPLDLKKIKFAIRNMEQLTQKQITSIKTMNEAQKEEIIVIYNEVLKSLVYYIEHHG